MLNRNALGLLAVVLAIAATVHAEEKSKPAVKPNPVLPPLVWLNDYSEAMRQAKKESRMLLVHFQQKNSGESTAIEKQLSSVQMRDKLANYLLAKVSVDATMEIDGKATRLLDHAAFSELRRGPGIAVVDLRHKKESYYGLVVSALPTAAGKFFQFRADQVPVLLDLPPGTLTQRSMIFAVRTHPERPASAIGQSDPILSDEASLHSAHQAAIGNQGHHQWGSRFQRILGRLSGRARGGAPAEIVAESWPGQDLNDSCVDCVQSWRQSSGHWSRVQAQNVGYGYDIRRGSNGIWYATGIFSQ